MSRLIDNAAMWLAVGAAVCLAIYLTDSATPLWYFLIPLIGSSAQKEKDR
jgi:heme/copper-type cytochrome/quinol oxidase subunit 1